MSFPCTMTVKGMVCPLLTACAFAIAMIEIHAQTDITVELVNGTTNSSGRVELILNGTTLNGTTLNGTTVNGTRGTICSTRYWHRYDATTVCRTLNYSYGFPVNNIFGQGSYPVLVEDLNCPVWGEPTLTNCTPKFSDYCPGSEVAAVVCLNDPVTDIQVELKNGSSPGNGRVELIVDGLRGSVCGNDFTSFDVDIVCKWLNFSSGFLMPSQLFPKGDGPILVDSLGCNFGHTSLSECPIRTDSGCEPRSDAGVFCSNDLYNDVSVELVPYGSESFGRILLSFAGVNVTLCSYFWSKLEADVVCRMLGYSSGVGIQGTYFGEIEDNFLTYFVFCLGSEQHILDCDWIEFSSCFQSGTVGVQCFNSSTTDTRLYGTGTENNGGVLQFETDFMNGTVGDVDYYYGYVSGVVDTSCTALGFGDGFGVRVGSFVKGHGQFQYIPQSCVANETDIFNCGGYIWYQANTRPLPDLEVRCISTSKNEHDVTIEEDSILDHYSDPDKSGRVQVNFSSTETLALCSKSEFSEGAEDICQQYGYRFAVPTGGFLFGDSSIEYCLNEYLFCPPTNNSDVCLSLGAAFLSSSSQYGHAGVICNNQSNTTDVTVQLRGGANCASGWVDLQLGDVNGVIADKYWTDSDASAICKMLNFSFGISAGLYTYNSSWTNVLLEDPVCSSSETSIAQCQFQSWGTIRQNVEGAVSVACFMSDVPIEEREVAFYLSNKLGPATGVVFVDIEEHIGTISFSSGSAHTMDLLCKEVGSYTYGKEVLRSYKTNMPIMVSDIACNESAESIHNCLVKYSGNSILQKIQLGLFCSNKPFGSDACVQLVGGNKSTNGKLEIVIDQHPVSVVYYLFQDYDLAGFFCGLLGYRNDTGSAAPMNGTEATMSFGWLPCVNDGLSLHDCVNTGFLYGSDVLRASVEDFPHTREWYSDTWLECQQNSVASSAEDKKCRDSIACPSNSTAVTVDGVPFCQCNDGFTNTSSGNCTDVDECLDESSCPSNSNCQNSVGSFTCVCNDGFEEDEEGMCTCSDGFVEENGSCVRVGGLDSKAAPLHLSFELYLGLSTFWMFIYMKARSVI